MIRWMVAYRGGKGTKEVLKFILVVLSTIPALV